MNARSLVLSLSVAAPLAAQQPDFRWEKALAAGSTVSAHNLNGDVTVTPSTSGKVEIVGKKRGNKRYVDDVTMRSVSGSLDSDFALTLNGRMSRNCLEARIGKGGRDLEASTVSGNVRLRAAKS